MIKFSPNICPCLLLFFFSNTAQSFSFVLTNVDSKWIFGFCRLAPGAQRALVIISYLPWHDFFFKVLNQITELAQEQSGSDLNSFLRALYGFYRRDVLANDTLHVRYGSTRRVFTCKSPDISALPCIPENVSLTVIQPFIKFVNNLLSIILQRILTEYLIAVGIYNMMEIFASMLHERRIVIVSSRLTQVSACVQAANALIFPMVWQHIYVPVLPPLLKDALLAPMVSHYRYIST